MPDHAQEAVTITIGVPGRVLSPNGRAHWGRKAKAKAAQRAEACLRARSWCLPSDQWPACSIKVLWFAKTKNGLRMDSDNIIGSLKGAVDGLVDAGLLEDDRGVTWLPPKIAVDKTDPRVELVVTRTPNADAGRAGA